MNAKKYFVTAVVLSVVFLALAASYRQTKHVANEAPNQSALSGASGKFGPTIETVLPANKAKGAAEIPDMRDLETGLTLAQPSIEFFDSRAEAVIAWIRSNHLDISCSVWPGGAVCVTYDMTVVPVDGKRWDATTEEELLANSALAPGQHSPRRLLVLGKDRPDTYMFRTGEGTLGMLRIVGVSPDGRGVNIRYKLINPSRETSVVSR